MKAQENGFRVQAVSKGGCMSSSAPKVDLFTICRGAALQLFQNALEKVNANIKDPNTDAAKKRKITLTFDISPYTDRSGAEVVCSVKETLVGVSGINSTIYIQKRNGHIEAYTQDVSQLDMFENENLEVGQTTE